MRLYTIRAYDKADNSEPARTYIISANTEEQAEQIFAGTAYSNQHERLVIGGGEAETNVPSPKFWGWTGGARVLKAPPG